MPEAYLQGETHVSSEDKDRLEDLSDGEFDGLFLEGVKDKVPKEFPFFFIFFFLGRLEYTYFLESKFFKKINIKDIDHYWVDASLKEIYDFSGRLKNIGIILASSLLTLFFLAFLASLRNLLPSILVYPFTIVVSLSIIPLFSLIYFTMHAFSTIYDRDQYMAKGIIDISEKKDYKKVLVNCGNMHIDGIARILEKNGWDVEIEKSSGKLYSSFLKAIKFISSPIKSLRQIL